MTDRTLQQIIESEPEPTEEERERVERCIDAWYERRADRAAEYVQQSEWSGYHLQWILIAPKPTMSEVREWRREAKEVYKFGPEKLQKALADITRFADSLVV